MATETRIGRGTVIRGAIRGDGDVEIEGRVEGVLEIDGDVTVLDHGRVRAEGDVLGRRVSIHGAVAGNVKGSTAVVLEHGARVIGDLAAPSIGIRPGGMLRGHVSTGDVPAPRPSRSAAARQAATEERPAARAVRPPPPRGARPSIKEAPAPARREPAARRAAPAPVMPVLKKGQKGQLKKRAGK
jgi:cytoskeletal protein CcmA (bactofilin family)